MEVITIMTIGNKILNLRKQNEMTQEFLANKLGVSNQAVSKWEADLCCPDIGLLPHIADIFNISIDYLFDRTTPKHNIVCSSLPWDDDKTLRVVAFVGQKLQDFKPVDDSKNLKVVYEGDALDIQSCISVNCMSVNGDINAGSYVQCGPVRGDITAGTYIACGPVTGDVTAGYHIQCGDISGDTTAGAHIECNNIGGDVTSQSHINCNNISGDATSQSHINCNNIEGDAHCDGDIYFNNDSNIS